MRAFGWFLLMAGAGGCSVEPANPATFGDDGNATTGAADSGSGGTGGPATNGSGGATTTGGSSDEGGSDTGGVIGSTGSDGGSTSGLSGSTSVAGSTSGSDSTTGGVVPGDDPVVGSVCGYGDNQQVTPGPIPPELHVVAVYEPQAAQISVDVDRIGIPMTLVLSSYSAVDWQLDLANGVQLDEVIVDGYTVSTVSGQGGAAVSNSSGPNHVESCGHDYNGGGGCNGQALVTAMEQLTGRDMASFIGCYNGTSFTLQ